jgi:hypothetical protein
MRPSLCIDVAPSGHGGAYERCLNDVFMCSIHPVRDQWLLTPCRFLSFLPQKIAPNQFFNTPSTMSFKTSGIPLERATSSLIMHGDAVAPTSEVRESSHRQLHI